VEIFDDLRAEQDRLEAILSGLGDDAWQAPSGVAGWTVSDVVLHLAQSDEVVVRTAADPGDGSRWDIAPGSLDAEMDRLVREQRAAPAAVFQRWQAARKAAFTALTRADPDTPLRWAATPLRPATLATTRLAEHWAHGLDITGPLGIAFPDTARLRHIAWLAHRTLPYAFTLAGLTPQEVYCELTAPDGDTWRFGPPDAPSVVTGPAGAFCRVGARRLAAARSGLSTRGPHAAAALDVLRNYAA
jgi:uncharacterized protein (TIGR03084 family)